MQKYVSNITQITVTSDWAAGRFQNKARKKKRNQFHSEKNIDKK